MSFSRMFILLGMLAIAASDLLILPERRNFRGFHDVREYGGDNGRLHYTPLLISLPLFRTLFRLDYTEDVLYGHIPLII